MADRRVFFVNRVYRPAEAATAQLLQDLAEGLVTEGFSVTVIAAGSPGLPARERINGVTVLRAGLTRAERTGLVHRGWNDLACARALCREVARHARPGDHVAALTDPPLIGVGLALVARRQRLRLVHWCQDLYPEVAMALAPGRPLRSLLAALRPLRDRAWRQAEHCVVLGTDMADLVQRRLPGPARVHVAANWAPAGLQPASGDPWRQAQGLGTDEMVVMYSGNLGRVHVLQPLLDVAEQTQERARLRFVFVGDGPQRAALQATAQARQLRNITFLPPQPRDRLAAALSAADLHLVTLRPECVGTVWPSKFYGILAVHRPLVYVGPAEAEIARLVVDHELGLSFRPGETDALARELVRLADDADRLGRLRASVAAFASAQPGVAGAVRFWRDLLATPRLNPPGPTGR